MSEPHTCSHVFEKNVQHVHISGTPTAPTGDVRSNAAGKYVCACGAWKLGEPQHQVEHLPADDSEGGGI